MDGTSPWTTLGSERIIDDPPWLTARRDRVQLPNGQTVDGYWVIEQPPWANVVAVTETDEVVLISQYRHGLGRRGLEIPGGYVDEGESALEGAQRELLEETGYGGGDWKELLTLAPNPAILNNLLHCFVATGVRVLAAPAREASEDLDVELHARDQIPALIQNGEIHHALHVAPLLAFLYLP
jgi:8-oxo-dGTP pyrophosphatase MutT (NUDIX family)